MLRKASKGKVFEVVSKMFCVSRSWGCFQRDCGAAVAHAYGFVHVLTKARARNKPSENCHTIIIFLLYYRDKVHTPCDSAKTASMRILPRDNQTLWSNRRIYDIVLACCRLRAENRIFRGERTVGHSFFQTDVDYVRNAV